MGLTELIFQIDPATIGTVELDASVRELHSATAKATRHPIEADSGWVGDITDHVHVDPLSLSIEGVVSGHPAEFAVAIVELFGSGKDPVQEAHQTMLDDLLTGRVVTIVTSLMEYPNMVLEKVEVTREAPKGNALFFSATATMIILATLETTELDTAADKKTKSGGKTATKPASAVQETQMQSVLARGLDWLGG